MKHNAVNEGKSFTQMSHAYPFNIYHIVIEEYADCKLLAKINELQPQISLYNQIMQDSSYFGITMQSCFAWFFFKQNFDRILFGTQFEFI